jgi:hypothetical protein
VGVYGLFDQKIQLYIDFVSKNKILYDQAFNAHYLLITCDKLIGYNVILKTNISTERC